VTYKRSGCKNRRGGRAISVILESLKRGCDRKAVSDGRDGKVRMRGRRVGNRGRGKRRSEKARVGEGRAGGELVV